MAGRTSRLTRVVGRALAIYGFILAVALYTPVTEWIAWPLYHVYPRPPRSDAIVVLEAWAFDDGELNESGLKRALRAVDLYRQSVANTVVLTGEHVTLERTGSALQPMARVLESNGVPQSAIVIEAESRDTHESAVHVATLARARGWTHVALVTDASHMPRAAASFRRAGLAVAPSPVLIWELGGAEPSIRFARLAVLAHEYAGLLWYWWRGWI